MYKVDLKSTISKFKALFVTLSMLCTVVAHAQLTAPINSSKVLSLLEAEKKALEIMNLRTSVVAAQTQIPDGKTPGPTTLAIPQLNPAATKAKGGGDLGGGNGVTRGATTQLFDFYENEGSVEIEPSSFKNLEYFKYPFVQLHKIIPGLSIMLRDAIYTKKWIFETKSIDNPNCLNSSIVAVQNTVLACQSDLEVRIDFEKWYTLPPHHKAGLIFHELLVAYALHLLQKDISSRTAVETAIRTLNRELFSESPKQTEIASMFRVLNSKGFPLTVAGHILPQFRYEMERFLDSESGVFKQSKLIQSVRRDMKAAASKVDALLIKKCFESLKRYSTSLDVSRSYGNPLNQTEMQNIQELSEIKFPALVSETSKAMVLEYFTKSQNILCEGKPTVEPTYVAPRKTCVIKDQVLATEWSYLNNYLMITEGSALEISRVGEQLIVMSSPWFFQNDTSSAGWLVGIAPLARPQFAFLGGKNWYDSKDHAYYGLNLQAALKAREYQTGLESYYCSRPVSRLTDINEFHFD